MKEKTITGKSSENLSVLLNIPALKLEKKFKKPFKNK